ncbi:peptide deformylase, mitochondrial-like [Dermacentor andersoni]|uniref:peptide deformylase, mitochondrial-like n=1 Tax=Dermacentor andersoni TaxID=34620 RepID=UPI0021552BD0|nr:peptide deformylase, mitochondrial-like isoform X1 [Dermacentor andersoni]
MTFKKILESCSRHISKLRNYGADVNLSPPYEFMCQVGDPVLRTRAEAVDLVKVTSAEVQNIINVMRIVMNKSYSTGISAPQVGCPLRIIMMEFPMKYMKLAQAEEAKTRVYQPFPLKVFINPTMEVINNQRLVFPEGCESIRGFTADVPRYYEVKVSGLNEKGEAHEWQAYGWPARIIQHEMDHLEGSLFIDLMDSRTFHFNYWHLIKKLPKSRLKQ